MWFILSLGSAFFDSVKDVFAKKSSVHIDEYTAAWSQRFFALFLLLPVMFFNLPEKVGRQFWVALAVVVVLNTINSILYMKALKLAPLSIVIPIASLTPIFILITSKFINQEFPKPLGVIGILVSIIGTYILQLSKRQESFIAPFTALFKERGSLLMLIVAVSWGITSSFDKLAVVHSNAYFYIGFSHIFYTLTLLPFVVRRHRLSSVAKNIKILAPIGISQGLGVMLQMLALPFTFASYVVAVKRGSSLFSVWWGKFIFNEEKIKERFVGTAIILVGVVLMILS